MILRNCPPGASLEWNWQSHFILGPSSLNLSETGLTIYQKSPGAKEQLTSSQKNHRVCQTAWWFFTVFSTGNALWARRYTEGIQRTAQSPAYGWEHPARPVTLQCSCATLPRYCQGLRQATKGKNELKDCLSTLKWKVSPVHSRTENFHSLLSLAEGIGPLFTCYLFWAKPMF